MKDRSTSELTSSQASSRAGAVAVLATLDTKGEEAAFVAERIRELGRQVCIVDLGVAGIPLVNGDISRGDVAKLAGRDLDEIARLPRGEALDIVSGVVRTLLRDGVESGELAGAIGVGGGTGTWLCNTIMRDLPLGFPKVIVSTAATHDASVDIMVMPSVADVAGLNHVLAPVLANAAAAICGMAGKPATNFGDTGRPAVALTMYGLTTKGATFARKLLEKAGLEVVVFHSNGAGGATMERLIDNGHFDAVLDWSTTEITDEIVGGVCTAGPGRLEAAGRRGIPQVVVPGAIDSINFLGAVPERMVGRAFHMHLPGVPLVRASSEEISQVGEWVARKLNASCGPARVVIPQGGFSAHDTPGGVFEDPDADAAFLTALRSSLQSRIPVRLVPEHINTEAFAQAAVEELLALLQSAPAPDECSGRRSNIHAQ